MAACLPNGSPPSPPPTQPPHHHPPCPTTPNPTTPTHPWRKIGALMPDISWAPPHGLPIRQTNIISKSPFYCAIRNQINYNSAVLHFNWIDVNKFKYYQSRIFPAIWLVHRQFLQYVINGLTFFQYIISSGGSRISCRGGVDPLGGVWTSEVGAFWQKCVQKRKNLVP